MAGLFCKGLYLDVLPFGSSQPNDVCHAHKVVLQGAYNKTDSMV